MRGARAGEERGVNVEEAKRVVWCFEVAGNPIGTNRLWRHGEGRRFRTAESIAWERAIQWAARAAGVQLLVGREWRVEVWYFHRHARRRQDVDGPVKLALDALTGIAWPDDRDVVSVLATRCQDAVNPRLEIVLEATDGASR